MVRELGSYKLCSEAKETNKNPVESRLQEEDPMAGVAVR